MINSNVVTHFTDDSGSVNKPMYHLAITGLEPLGSYNGTGTQAIITLDKNVYYYRFLLVCNIYEGRSLYTGVRAMAQQLIPMRQFILGAMHSQSYSENASYYNNNIQWDITNKRILLSGTVNDKMYPTVYGIIQKL